MLAEKLIQETGARISDVFKHPDYARWTRSEAAKIEDPESGVVMQTSIVLKEFIKRYRWGAVSSNNVYQESLPGPVSLIVIPIKNRYTTIINPEITKKSESKMPSIEGCGSLGEFVFQVMRHEHITIKGYFFEDRQYDSVYLGSGDSVFAQHEVDHLHGRLISDLGPLVYLNSTIFPELEWFNKMTLNRALESKPRLGDPIFLRNNELIRCDRKYVPEESDYGETIRIHTLDTNSIDVLIDLMPFKYVVSQYHILKKEVIRL